jgi:probable HAF family extracellular repeat protein
MSSSARRSNGSAFTVAVSLAITSLGVAVTAPRSHAASLGPGDIRVLGGTGSGITSEASDINNDGIVIGSASAPGVGIHPFLDPGFSNKTIEPLPSVGVTQYSGQIAKNGTAMAGTLGTHIAWARPGASGSSVFSLGTLGGATSDAMGINSSGVVVGTSQTASGEARAFRHPGIPGAAMVDLGIENGVANDINDAGVIVGTANGAPFILTPAGTRRDLGSPFGNITNGVNAVNESGALVGYGFVPRAHQADPLITLPFKHNGGPGDTYQTLPVRGLLNFSFASDINDDGFVLGGDASGVLLWRPDNTLVDLNEWLDQVNPVEGAKWLLASPGGINNARMVTGWGYYDDGTGTGRVVRGFVLDASGIVPEPTGFAIVGFAGIAALRRRRRETSR